MRLFMQFDSANSYGKIEKRLLRENEVPILENQSLLDRIKTLETIVDELHKVLERQQCEIVNLKIFIGFKC